MQLQLPLRLATVVHTTVPVGCVVTVTGVPGVPVPANVGVVVLTGVPAGGAVIVGAVLSTVKVRVAAGLALPAASIATTLIVCTPFVSALLTHAHKPDGETAVVTHKVWPSSSLMVTVLPGSAMPLIIGVVLAVVVPVTGAVIVGATGATVSMLNDVGRLAGPALPAGSVCLAVIVWGPLLSGALGVQVQLPDGLTTAMHIGVPPSLMVTVAPGSPVPLSVGCVPLSTAPAAGVLTTGARGAVASTTNGRVATGLVFPAGSVAVTFSVCGPSASGVPGVQLQFPSASAVAVHTVTPPSTTLIVLLGSALPLIVGRLLVVVTPAVGAMIVGASGAAESIVIGSVVGVLTFPAGSFAVTCKVLGPSVNGVAGVQVQLPLASVTAVQIGTPPLPIVTVVLGAAVPLIVGVVSLIGVPGAGDVTAGGAGATVSTVTVVAAAGPVLPAGSVAVAWIVCTPSTNGVVGVQLHAPFALAMAVQIGTPPSLTLTVLLGSAVPLMTGEALLISALETGALITGMTGAALSTVKVTGAVACVPPPVA